MISRHKKKRLYESIRREVDSYPNYSISETIILQGLMIAQEHLGNIIQLEQESIVSVERDKELAREYRIVGRLYAGSARGFVKFKNPRKAAKYFNFASKAYLRSTYLVDNKDPSDKVSRYKDMADASRHIAAKKVIRQRCLKKWNFGLLGKL